MNGFLMRTDTKMNEDRARRIEKQKAERAAYEETKRSEVNERLLEEASAPAYVFTPLGET